MQYIELLDESITVLKTNKLRTGLSALGIIIGIGSVITLMTLGQASQLSVTDRIQSLGANLLTINPGTQGSGFLRGSGGNVTTLTYDDALAIKNSNRINTVDTVAASYSGNSQASYNSNNDNVQVTGVSADYFKIRNIEVLLGSGIGEQDNLMTRRTVVVSESVVENLLESNPNPIGETLRIDGVSFTIIGITEDSTGFGERSNLSAYIPLTTAQDILYGANYVSNIYVSAKNKDVMDAAENQMGYLLLERHGLDNPEDADFSISSQTDLLETVSEVTQTFTTLLTGIAAISLIVGGIGIMNIMLVTVTERTREVGIRKALGAKSKVIIAQFLIESVLLTVAGGLLGVLIGIGSSLIITNLMSLPNTVSVSGIVLAFVVSCFIGVVFGIYPAYKASKLQPIEALRYE